MKKILLGSVILNIIGILLVSYFLLNKDNTSNINNVKSVTQKEALETVIGKKNNKGKIITKEECKDIINGKNVDILKDNPIYIRYIKLKDIDFLGGKEINEFNNVILGKCDLVREKNIQFCKDLKNKVISKDYTYTGYEKILLKSLINKENYCTEVDDKQKEFECNEFYKNAVKLDNIVFPSDLNVSENIFYLFYENKGKEIYNTSLNNLFLKACIEINKRK